ncbi:excinuclease ABC subunit UvrA [Candidatus Poribacteria bacterium]|nr:excinuclease ABC subunit UvrA [Candidatus Poribacteria bacterium]
MAESSIDIHGAREHNLKNIDIQLPKNKLIVFTGVSGSGKSSLAIDTVYAEGQRRYIESLSAYARQFLGQLGKAEVDKIVGLSPSIAIDQGSTGHNPRSTVATVTEIYDYLRVLFARAGQFNCLECGQSVGSQTIADIVEHILTFPPRTRLMILAPIVKGRRGEYRRELSNARKLGFVRARIDGEVHEINSDIALNPNQTHNIDLVVDRIIIKDDVHSRVAEAVETALSIGDDSIIVNVVSSDKNVNKSASDGEDLLFSRQYACTNCQISYDIPEPRHFSYNSPYGMCEQCRGLGMQMAISPKLIIRDESLPILNGAIASWEKPNENEKMIAKTLAKHLDFNLNTPWIDLTPEQKHAILYGTGDTILTFHKMEKNKTERKFQGRFQGIIPTEERRCQQLDIEDDSDDSPDYFVKMPCRECNGSRLKNGVKAVTIDGLDLTEVLDMSIHKASEFFETVELPEREAFIAIELLKEIRGRLGFLLDVGLGYLTLSRSAPTLSGGEAQRIRLASQVGAGLRDVTYVLDEPSIGLHPRDHAGLLKTLLNLRNQGNTVIVVEHDEATMLVADWLVDFGPGAGIKGGQITGMGTPADLIEDNDSLTIQYLRGDKKIVQPDARRPTGEKWVQICNARQNNLKEINPKIPVGTLCCVTGVSGSGKSSLIHEILYNALARDLMKAKTVPGDYDQIHGLIDDEVVPITDVIDKIINIDMAPIGRTPRSNPATYTKIFDNIRSFYKDLPDAKLRGYKPGRFSFNVPGGRCEACVGNGAKKVDMGLLADVWIECDVCNGKRYNIETLAIKFKDKNISEVLEMDIDTALNHFSDLPKIAKGLQLLHDVGLYYIKLGQPAPTLSGGEAQRIKLAKELSKKSTGKTLYILDEPTTGLHFDDVNKLLTILHRLVDEGNTVVVVEHNMEVINSSDYLIDLGPEGGESGGNIVTVGTPEEVQKNPDSYTGRALNGEFDLLKSSDQIPTINENGDNTQSEINESNTELNKSILVRGAEENNLKKIDIEIPHKKLTALTGVSGSGKTSLALDTIYAEGQRRYIETLSAYARQFIGTMEKPKVAKIDGLSPAIAITHSSPSQNPRSTVATITEIHDGLRTLYARWGQPHCPNCNVEVRPQSAQQIVDQVFTQHNNKRIDILSPLTNFMNESQGYEVAIAEIRTPGLKGNEDYVDAFKRLQKIGYARVQIDGEIFRLDETPDIKKRRKHEVFLVIDRIQIIEEEKSRLTEAIELALQESEGFVIIEDKSNEKNPDRIFFSEHAMCSSCGQNFPQLTPRHFSFNNRLGACSNCEGIGRSLQNEHEICLSCNGTRLNEFPRFVQFSEKTIAELMAMSISDINDFFSSRVFSIETHLATSAGAKEAKEAKSKVRDVATSRVTHPTLQSHTSPEFEAQLLRQIQFRLKFLQDIGLGYLGLDRPAPTLSGGEIRRIRLASQLGTGLTGVTYILDEPSIGLHPRDQERLIDAMKDLRDIGNSVLVVEHDRDTILASDHIIDFGPKAGKQGGEIIAIGSPRNFTDQSTIEMPSDTTDDTDRNSKEKLDTKGLTQAYLSHEMQIPVPVLRRKGSGKWLRLLGAETNNLKNINIKIPYGTLTCVTGVSGCGKSSLIEGTLRPALEARKSIKKNNNNSDNKVSGAKYDKVQGITPIDRIIHIDQKPIGETPRSNPATYTDLFTKIREMFAELPDAKLRGFNRGRFSFNLSYGQCEVCDGQRFNRVEMHFLPDVWIPCDSCNSTGYNSETLEVKYKGKNIAEILQMTVLEALEIFNNIDRIKRPLQTLADVGLDYIQLGQAATTLSGGEAQRVKLAKELARRQTGTTLYIMDEPTTGLHFDDVQKLLNVINKLVDAGNTIVAIEHNIDVIKSADWVIDLGPEGSDEGGHLVGMGTPEEVAKVNESHTARFLREVL